MFFEMPHKTVMKNLQGRAGPMSMQLTLENGGFSFPAIGFLSNLHSWRIPTQQCPPTISNFKRKWLMNVDGKN